MKLIQKIIQFHRNPKDVELSTVAALSLPILCALAVWTSSLFGDVPAIATFASLLVYIFFLLVKVSK
jgi:hypothetical protein